MADPDPAPLCPGSLRQALDAIHDPMIARVRDALEARGLVADPLIDSMRWPMDAEGAEVPE